MPLLLIAARAIFVGRDSQGRRWPSSRCCRRRRGQRFASIAFASPLDFFLNALLVAGLVVLAVSSFALWRAAHRPGIGVGDRRSARPRALFFAVQLGAGVAVAALVMSYEWFLRTHVSQTPVDIVRFALDRLDPTRLLVIVGLIALNAAVVGLAILLYRLAWSPWVFPGSPAVVAVARGLRVWLLPAAIFFGAFAADDRAPQWPSLLVVRLPRRGVAGASLCADRASWLASHEIAAVVSGGRAAVAGAVPIAGRRLASSRRQLIESRYAPEVMNQRQDVRTKLQNALNEINRIVALDDLVRASDPPVSGPPPTDAAFLVWSQTSLATERLTSSVELHNAAGAMVSRFAMNLPDFAQPQPWIEERVTGRFSRRCRRCSRKSGGCCMRASDVRARRPPGRIGGRPLDARLRQPLVHLRAEPVCRADALRPVAAGAAAARRCRVLRLRLEPPRALQLGRGRAAAYAKRPFAAPTVARRRSGPRSRAARGRSMRTC